MLIKFKIDSFIKVKDFLDKKITKTLQRTLANKDINYIVNNQSVKNYYEMKPNDELIVIVPVLKSEIIPTKGNLDILFEDDYLLILNKPSNIATIPTRKHYKTSLANTVQYYYVTKGINAGMHFVNRLDAPTSGIVVVAKNTYIADTMKENILEKKYLLKVHGILNDDAVIKTTIVKDETSIIKRKNIEGSKAITSFKVIRHKDDFSFVEATLHTGKTHQLRLHFNYINHPIVGDELYGVKTDDFTTMYLHSYYLKFIHPVSKEIIEINSKPLWF